MYCVIGEKILRCEVKKQEEMSSLCKVGTSKKEQVISNNRLFQTEEEAAKFMKKRKANKVNESTLVANAVATCNALYEKLYKETGIEVRTIDRQWTVTSAEKHITKLKRTLTDKPETHDKNVSKSFSFTAAKPSKEHKKFNSNGSEERKESAYKGSSNHKSDARRSSDSDKKSYSNDKKSYSNDKKAYGQEKRNNDKKAYGQEKRNNDKKAYGQDNRNNDRKVNGNKSASRPAKSFGRKTK